MKFKFHDIEQNSDEWFELRCGKLTTSKLPLIMAKYGKAFGDPAIKYAHKLAKEQVTGKRDEEDSFRSVWMDNGHEWEPIARYDYEFESFNEVTNGGFCESLEIANFGGSPDGLVLPEHNYSKEIGGIEIKSVSSFVHRCNIKRETFDPTYKWQMFGNILLCDLDWLDFISYGYTYPEEKRLYTYRILKEEYQEEIDKIKPRIEQFMELVEKEKQYL